MEEKRENIFMGWKCPQCGRIFSPYLHTCPYCTGEEVYSQPVELPKETESDEKPKEKFNLTEELRNEWFYGPAEGGVD